MKFRDLEFKAHANYPGGVHATVFFPNGQGASVICTPSSYGGDGGLYELAVLKGTEESWGFDHDTSVTGDVEGYLSKDSVSELLAQIEALPKA